MRRLSAELTDLGHRDALDLLDNLRCNLDGALLARTDLGLCLLCLDLVVD